MNTQLLFLLTLETTALIVLVGMLIYYTVQRNKNFERTFSQELREQYDLLFKTQLTTMQKELDAVMRAALKDARALIEKNHHEVTALTKQHVEALTSTLDSEMSEILQTERAAVVAALEKYQEKKCVELDAQSEAILQEVLRQKLWKSLKTADKHTLSVAALKELLATGELK